MCVGIIGHSNNGHSNNGHNLCGVCVYVQKKLNLKSLWVGDGGMGE